MFFESYDFGLISLTMAELLSTVFTWDISQQLIIVNIHLLA